MGEAVTMWDPATFLFSKKHSKLNKTTGAGEAAGCVRGTDPEEWTHTHTPAKETSTCCPYWKRTQEGRSGSSARELCSWARQLLFLWCTLQMSRCPVALWSQLVTSKTRSNPLPRSSLMYAHIFHQFPSQLQRNSMLWRKCKPSKIQYIMLFTWEERLNFFFFFTLILPNNSLCKLTCKHMSRRN